MKRSCMSIFSNIGFVDQSKPCTQVYLHNIASCINLKLQIVIIKKRLIQTCIIGKRTSISIFSKIGLVDQSKPCTQIYLHHIATCINLQLPIVIFKKMIISDMCHRKTYMYINFQQNRVCRSVKTVYTNLFAQYRKLQKFATTNSNLKKSIL